MIYKEEIDKIISKILLENINNNLFEGMFEPNNFNSELKLNHILEIDNQILVKYIDHTLLKPDATFNEIEKLCKEGLDFGFQSVCVNPAYVEYCSNFLAGTEVKICSVVGFPLGASTIRIKELETEELIANGAAEIDMVLNIGHLKSKQYNSLYGDIKNVSKVCKNHNAKLKVIIETCLLNTEEKIIACIIAKKAEADFVKTSTGFAGGGATIEDVFLMKYIVGENVYVKASGGIKNREDALKFISAGADRIGSSSSVNIIKSGNF